MAKYKKGQSGNPAGRPKGSKNKPELRAILQDIVEADGVEAIRTFLQDPKASARQKAELAAKLLDFFIPKQRSVTEVVDLSTLTPEQLDEIWNQTLERVLNEE